MTVRPTLGDIVSIELSSVLQITSFNALNDICVQIDHVYPWRDCFRDLCAISVLSLVFDGVGNRQANIIPR